jgi:hypothetical protein
VKKTFRKSFPKAKIITDVAAARQDLANYNIVAFGTLKGNCWLREHLGGMPVQIYADSIVADTVLAGSNLRFISDWQNPFNRENSVIICTAQKAEDIVGIGELYITS